MTPRHATTTGRQQQIFVPMPTGLVPAEQAVAARLSEESVQRSTHHPQHHPQQQQPPHAQPQPSPPPPPPPPGQPQPAQDAPIYHDLLHTWAHRGRTLPGCHDPEWARLVAPAVRPGQFSTGGRDPQGGGR
ncbi:hypothetical protein ABZX40_00240 [Streptomyces sp. NPDC004610]|uniref:hypothetical protein n=1 Tax=unclassified Streptomyces TaxID=2593676 RepID=UPI0033ADF592